MVENLISVRAGFFSLLFNVNRSLRAKNKTKRSFEVKNLFFFFGIFIKGLAHQLKLILYIRFRKAVLFKQGYR